MCQILASINIFLSVLCNDKLQMRYIARQLIDRECGNMASIRTCTCADLEEEKGDPDPQPLQIQISLHLHYKIPQNIPQTLLEISSPPPRKNINFLDLRIVYVLRTFVLIPGPFQAVLP